MDHNGFAMDVKSSENILKLKLWSGLNSRLNQGGAV